MIRLFVAVGSGATVYVPAPAKGTVAGAQVTWQDSTVEPDDTMTLYQDSDIVCLIEAVNTAGLDVEIGVPDSDNRYTIFDPDSTTATETVIKVTNGVSGAALLMIEFDDYAYVEQTAKQA